jgi:hypothetical protein
MSHESFRRRRRLAAALRRVALIACALSATGGVQAASLDGAGRIVILPFAVSGPQRESTIYITNPSDKRLTAHALYVGAEGTPFASSQGGVVFCTSTPLDPGQSVATTLSSLCPISTADVENMGYVRFIVFGGFDAAPIEVSSLVDVRGGAHFAVDAVPTAAFDPGRTIGERERTLRVRDLIGDVQPTMPVELFAHCAVATQGEAKEVIVQLQEYSTGVAVPVGNLMSVSLAPWRMEILGDIFRRAGLPAGRSANVTAEFYAAPGPSPTSFADGAALIAWCSVEDRASRHEDVRLAETPAPRDHGRWRGVVRADSEFGVGPFHFGYALPLGTKARMSVYLRHEDRVRCHLTESVLKPNAGVVPWQELRVIDPDGNVVAGGNDQSDTGIFFTGPKNGTGRGVNGRWTLEISWREGLPGDFSGIPKRHRFNVFGIECTSTNGLSQLLPLDTGSDDF